MLIGYRSGFYTDDELRVALHMATDAGAAVLGHDAYGLKAGHDASFVIVKAPNAPAAVAAVPSERAIVRSGKFRDDASRLQFESGKAGQQHGVAIGATA
ncbi:cytosine deaminase [Caballeronia novacaledonica]|uniref:Cytosine deaminase n=1 Tax=Caballeronia novacaledonica TaxID=1544861 RepID=A0A2U3IAG6_9BURK|nr:cytosine deaminase [Caballeronia novacaledonica]